MKLKQVILKNFGIFQTPRVLDLNDDLVVIHGTNFSGKTTIARAIYFALCGKVLTTGLKPQGVVSPHELSATTGIVYHHEDETYRLYRSTKGDLRLEVFQQNWEQINEDELKLPALNPQQWQIGCFLQEHEVGEFLSKAPATRRDLLNHILGVEQIRAVRDAFVMVRRLAKRLEKTTLSRQSSIRLDRLSDCSQEITVCRNSVNVLEERLTHQPGDGGGEQRLHQEWEQRKQHLEQQLQSFTAETQTLLSGFNTVEALHSAFQQISSPLAGREQVVKAAEASTEHRIRLDAQFQQTEQQLANLHDLRGQGQCPTCLQPLSEEHLHQVETQLHEQRTTLEESLATARAEEQESRETLKLLEQLAQRQHDLQRRVEKLELLDKNLAEIRTELDPLKAKLAAVVYKTENERDRKSLHKALEQSRARLKELETQQALFQEHSRQLADINAQAERATHHRLLSEWAAAAVEETMQAVMGTSLHRAESSVIECLREFNLLDGGVRIDLEASRLMPDLDGRAFHALSGSEKAILCLSIKLALSRLMTGSDFLVLDDPVQHLDEARRQQMRDFLLSLIPQKQVIVLTNDRNFAEMLPEGKRIDLS